MNTTKIIKLHSYCNIDIETNNDFYNYYPYLDSLQYFNTYDQRLTADEEHGSDILKLDTTNGTAHSTMCSCEQCSADMEEDDSIYIETEDMRVCDDCAIYCDERDEYILTDDAVYNNNSGQYLYRGDLDL